MFKKKVVKFNKTQIFYKYFNKKQIKIKSITK